MKSIANAFEIEPLVLQRALDAADKQELIGNPSARIPILLGYGIPAEKISAVLALTEVKCLEDFISIIGYTKNTEELASIFSLLPEHIRAKVQIDLNLARGADYYTGMILEGIIPGISVGAVLGGGRFDNMTQKFTNGDQMPAVGMAFGFDRLIIALNELGKFNDNMFLPKTIVCYSENNIEGIANVASDLRDMGFEVLSLTGQDLQKMDLDEYTLKSNPAGIINLDSATLDAKRPGSNHQLLIDYLQTKGIY